MKTEQNHNVVIIATSYCTTVPQQWASRDVPIRLLGGICDSVHDNVQKRTTSISIAILAVNKANLRDLIALIRLVIMLKSETNHPIFSPCDLEI